MSALLLAMLAEKNRQDGVARFRVILQLLKAAKPVLMGKTAPESPRHDQA